MPVERLQVSGGTAPFFKLKLLSPTGQHGGSENYYIGKDLSHAKEEFAFYEQARKRLEFPCGSGLERILSYLFEYQGVLTAPEQGKEEEPPMELLVLRNLFDGAKRLRMLDIKIGQKTASAGWYGKSVMTARYRAVVDGYTNSGAEGFRLAGFNNPPASFSSRDPLLDIGGGDAHQLKKAMRVVFSQMPGEDMLRYFLDVHQDPGDPGDAALETTLTACELVEVALSEMVRQLVGIALACRYVQLPQKWVGSSVILGFDCGGLPPRNIDEATLRDSVKVHILDWGRSELNTVDNQLELTEAEQLDRQVHWHYYVAGVDRLAWEACRAYKNRFGHSSAEFKVQLHLYDFDSTTADDFLGSVDIPLERTEGDRTVDMKKSGSTTCTITYSMTRRIYPQGKRLKESWRLTVHKATNVPIADTLRRNTDPFVTVTMTSEDGRCSYSEQSSVQASTLNPSWEETFDLPVSVAVNFLAEDLEAAASGLAGKVMDGLVPGSLTSEQENEVLDQWAMALDEVCPGGVCAGAGGRSTARRKTTTGLAGAAEAVKGVAAGMFSAVTKAVPGTGYKG
eukprot:TRINITY_DN21355_c0_g1_i3.p1 TRINITY_DN21355_c0_g1~~TRINITY_DN21355_c0_g1_i3.p1  ORF type:complete len:566 (-),score=136.74 TRINITY_DN21355_c0_g1_i3:206-1903(-)